MDRRNRHERTGGKPIIEAMIFLVAVIAVACAFAWFSSSPADTSRTRTVITGTGKFTQTQIRDAETVALKHLRGFHGCRIDSISYDDKQSKALLALEQSAAQEGGSSSISTAIEQHGINNVIMLTSDFTCAGSISLPHGKTTGWGLWYAWNPQSTDAHNGWTFIDEGY